MNGTNNKILEKQFEKFLAVPNIQRDSSFPFINFCLGALLFCLGSILLILVLGAKG
jgi:hypothetical protein